MPQPANAAPDWADLEVAALYRKWRGAVLPKSEIAAALHRARAVGLREGSRIAREAEAGGTVVKIGGTETAGLWYYVLDLVARLELEANAAELDAAKRKCS